LAAVVGERERIDHVDGLERVLLGGAHQRVGHLHGVGGAIITSLSMRSGARDAASRRDQRTHAVADEAAWPTSADVEQRQQPIGQRFDVGSSGFASAVPGRSTASTPRPWCATQRD
jgi:hypothetical protein